MSKKDPAPSRRKNQINIAGKKRSERALKSWATRRANAAAKANAPVEPAVEPAAPVESTEAPAPATAPTDDASADTN